MPEKPLSQGTVLAFDFGAARIGVAVGETLLASAHPLGVIAAPDNKNRFEHISGLIGEWQPACLVVGLPVHMDGTEHDITVLSRTFARRLHGRFGLPVFLADERLTSVLAESLLREAGIRGKKQKKVSDSVAAQIMLLSFFESGGTPLDV